MQYRLADTGLNLPSLHLVKLQLLIGALLDLRRGDGSISEHLVGAQHDLLGRITQRLDQLQEDPGILDGRNLRSGDYQHPVGRIQRGQGDIVQGTMGIDDDVVEILPQGQHQE